MPDDLKKIELDTNPTPATLTPKKRFSWIPIRSGWNMVRLSLGILALVFVILGILLLPLKSIIAQAKVVAARGRELGTAVKSQDLVKAKDGLAGTRTELVTLQNKYKRVRPLKFVPILGWYIADGEHVINAAMAGLTAGDRTIEALEPNADILGLKGKSTFVSGTADDRIQTAVKTMSALTPKIQEMATSIDTLRKELDSINSNHYPQKIGKIVVRAQLISMKETIDNAANLFVNAQPLLLNLPKILGEPKEQRYLILFQNDKELRSTGGFITAYAQFRFVRGKVILEKADDIYAMDEALTKKFPAPPEITKFHKGVYNFNIRDSNLSPDLVISMKQFEALYANVKSKENIDGIWLVDTHVLVEALKILGPMNVYGREFSAVLDKRCDCPKAVYELEDYSTRPVNYVREDRKDIIGILLRDLLQKALGVSPSQYWGQLFQMLITQINEKHVMTYFHDSAIQKAAESFNMAGRIMTASESAAVLKYEEGNGWDYLHVNNSNMSGAKANMFVSSKMTKDTTINNDATITTKITIDYKNPYPGSDCGLESGGLCLNAPLRNWVRVYVPVGSRLVESRGAQSPKDNKPIPMDSYESLGKTVFEGFLIVNPLGTAKLELSYNSPFKSTDGKYRLLIQKQPGTEGAEVLLRLGGKDRKKMELLTDTEVTL